MQPPHEAILDIAQLSMLIASDPRGFRFFGPDSPSVIADELSLLAALAF